MSCRVPTIEPRTVMPLSTMSKIGGGKSPGGRPLNTMVPPRRAMPIACANAFGWTAVTSTPCAPPVAFCTSATDVGWCGR